MTVEIQIRANPTQAQAGINQVQRDLERLKRAAQEFNRIDLSAGTEDLQRDLEKVQRNIDDISDPRRNKRFHERLKSLDMGGASLADILENWDRLHPDLDEKERAKRKQRLVGNVLRGSQWEPSASPAAGVPAVDAPPVGSAPVPQPSSSSPRDTLVSGLMGGAKFGLGLMGVQTGMGVFSQGFEMAKDVADNTDQFMRRARNTGDDFDYLREQLRATGDAFGIANDEASRLALAFQRASASSGDVRSVTRDTNDAVGFARGFGMDPMQATQQFGRMQYFGIGGLGMTEGQRTISPSQRQLALQIAGVIAKGGLWGKSEEVVATFSQAVETFGRSSLNMLNTEGLAGYQSAMLELAQQTNRPGLVLNQGMMGALDRGIRQPGGGVVGQFASWQALGAQMGTFNPLALEWMQAGGAFENIRRLNPRTGQLEDTGTTTAQAILRLVEQQAKPFEMENAPDEWKDLAAGKAAMTLLGLENIRQGQALIQANRLWTEQEQGGMSGLQQAAKEYGVDLTKLEGDAIKDIAQILVKPQDISAIQKIYANWQPRIPLEKPEESELKRLFSLTGAGQEVQNKEFVTALVKTMAEHGGQATPATELNKGIADLKSLFEKQMGEKLHDGLAEISGWLQKIYELQAPRDPEEQSKRQDEGFKRYGEIALKGAQETQKAWQRVVDSEGTPAQEQALKDYAETRTRAMQAANAERGALGEQYGWSEQVPEPPTVQVLKDTPSPGDASSSLYRWYRRWRGMDTTTSASTSDASTAPVQKALGGLLPGYGGGDRIPALLEAGEFVINKAATAQHRTLLEQINSGDFEPIRRATGGLAERGQTFHPLDVSAELPVQKALGGLLQGVTDIARGVLYGGPTMFPVSGNWSAWTATGDGLPWQGAQHSRRNYQGFDFGPPPGWQQWQPQQQPMRGYRNVDLGPPPGWQGWQGQQQPMRGYQGMGIGSGKGWIGLLPTLNTASADTSADSGAPLDWQPQRSDSEEPSGAAPELRHKSTGATLPRPESNPQHTPPKPPPPSNEPSALPQGRPLSGKPAEFVRAVQPAATRAAAELGVSPEVLIAQAAHETGWGRHIPKTESTFSHNLFGIKTSKGWTGESVSNASAEHGAGGWTKPVSNFRAYDSYEASFTDYVRFLKSNKRYASALEAASEGNDAEFVRRMHRAGYATDPNYASKVLDSKRRVESVTHVLGGATTGAQGERTRSMLEPSAAISKGSAAPATPTASTVALPQSASADHYLKLPPSAAPVTWQSMAGLPEIAAPTATSPVAQAPQSNGFGMGQLEVLIRQQDQYGARLGNDATHVMNLRVPAPYGRIDLEAINGR